MRRRELVALAKDAGGIPRHWPVGSIERWCDGQVLVWFLNPRYGRGSEILKRSVAIPVDTRTYNRIVEPFDE